MPSKERRLDEQPDRLIYDSVYRVYNIVSDGVPVRVLTPEEAVQTLRTEFGMQPPEALDAITRAFAHNGFPIPLDTVRFPEDPNADYPVGEGIVWPVQE